MGEVLKKFEKVIIPELNMGQLLFLLRARFPGINAAPISKVQGVPFQVSELKQKIAALL